jgi:outer membrane protein
MKTRQQYWMGTIVRGAMAMAVMTALVVRPAQAQTPQTPPANAQAAAANTLPLTMEQAVTMGLEFNLGLKSEKLNLDVASQSIVLSRAAFLPQVSSAFTNRSAKSLPSDFTQGSSDITSAGLNVTASVAQQLRFHGGTYSLAWNGNRSTQTGGISSFNPRLGSGLTASFSQPLLKGFRTNSSRTSLITSEKNLQITDLQLQAQVVQTQSNVQLAYLGLKGAIEGKKVAESNMAIAEKSLEQSKARVAVGQSPQIEIIQSQAQVASTRVSLLQADVRISTAEDQLRTLILDPNRPDYWTIHLEPTQAIQLMKREINADEAIKNALANRLDLAAQKKSLEVTDINLALSKDSTLPGVDFNAGYSASGTAGTQFVFGSGFPPTILDSTSRSFGGALSDTFAGTYPSWSVGVNVTYPIGRTAAEASYAQAQVRKKQQVMTLEQLQIEIVRQVRDAARQVENSYQQVEATQAFREAAEQQLDAEQRRFAAGMSTTLDLQIRERDLANARVTELNAMIDYNRALIIFDRVQKAQ